MKSEGNIIQKNFARPVPVAYCLFVEFIFFAAFFGLVVAANIAKIHSSDLWIFIGFTIG